MRKLIILVVLAASLYGGYWFVGKNQINKTMVMGLSSIDDGTYDVTYSDLRTRGFPSRFDTTITDLVLADPIAGVEWSAPLFQIFALAYRPNEVIAVFPNEQTVTLQGEVLTLFTNDMRASGKVRANPALSFQNATVDMENPRFRTEEGAELAMARLLAAMRLTPDTTQTYDVFFEANSIVLPAAIRATLDPGDLQPPIIQSLRLDSDVTLSTPIELNGPNAGMLVERISLKEVSFRWGQISFTAIGDATPDVNGLLNGSVAITARNWKTLIDLAIASNLMTEQQRFLYIGIAENIDETPHIDDTLTITITITDGTMAIGQIPLGPAPVLR